MSDVRTAFNNARARGQTPNLRSADPALVRSLTGRLQQSCEGHTVAAGANGRTVAEPTNEDGATVEARKPPARR